MKLILMPNMVFVSTTYHMGFIIQKITKDRVILRLFDNEKVYNSTTPDGSIYSINLKELSNTTKWIVAQTAYDWFPDELKKQGHIINMRGATNLN